MLKGGPLFKGGPVLVVQGVGRVCGLKCTHGGRVHVYRETHPWQHFKDVPTTSRYSDVTSNGPCRPVSRDILHVFFSAAESDAPINFADILAPEALANFRP